MAENLGYARVQAPAQVVVQVIWSRRALADVAAIQAYVEQFSPLAAQRLALRLLNAGDSLCEFPERARAVAGGRRVLASVKPYLIYYRVEAKSVVIITVRHGARRPL